MIDHLINKTDSSELVRDKIAQILADETANQQILATNAALDPDDWKLRVYLERSNPWETWMNNQDDKSPIVNVSFDIENFPQANGDTIHKQRATGQFNVDVFGLGISKRDGSGHIAGDEAASLECQRAMRLVRNILFSSDYAYLGLRGLVARRWPQNIQMFQPNIDARQMQQVVAARLVVAVEYNEYSPQATPDTLEHVSIDIQRALDGQVIAEADYIFTPPI